MNLSEYSSPKPTLNFERLSVPIKKGLAFYPVHQVIYFRSEGNYSYLRTTLSAKEIFISASMASLEAKLGNQFLRCHNQYLINSALIEMLVKTHDHLEFIMQEGVKVPISRKRKKGVMMAVNG